MRRRTWWWAVGGAALVVAGAVGVAVVRRGNAGPDVDLGVVVTRDVFRSYVSASGEIVATRFADIGSSVMGRIVELLVAEGDRVRAGQVVARIDPVQARSQSDAAAAQAQALEADVRAARQSGQAAAADLAQAEARAREAARTLQRVQDLHAEGLTTAADLDASQAGADAARAQVMAAAAALDRARQSEAAAARRAAGARAAVAGARDLLSKTEIAAPIAGVVTRLQVRLGEMVVFGIQNQPGTTLMTISDLSDIDAEIKVAEADVLRVKDGQPARVTLEAVPGRDFGGRVVEVGASALPVQGAGASAREFRAVVRLDQPDPGLRPGLTCDAEILAAERRGVLTVPLQAVVLRPGADGGDRTGVFTVKDRRAVFVAVRTGIIGGLDIEVEGVSRDTHVIVGPFQVLRDLEDGAPVRVPGRS